MESIKKSGNKNRTGKPFPAELVIAAVLTALIIGGVVFAYRLEEGRRKSVEGTYSCLFPINGSDEKSITVYYKFDAGKGTYEELWGERTLMTGSYDVEKDTITLVSDGNEELGAESETEYFYIKENLLIPKNYIYEGSIPSESTFDAECTMTDSAGAQYTVSFHKDGSYTYTTKGPSGEQTASLTGKYEREGQILHRTNEKGAVLTDYYIYDGRLAGIFYTKEQQSGEENNE